MKTYLTGRVSYVIAGHPAIVSMRTALQISPICSLWRRAVLTVYSGRCVAHEKGSRPNEGVCDSIIWDKSDGKVIKEGVQEMTLELTEKNGMLVLKLKVEETGNVYGVGNRHPNRCS